MVSIYLLLEISCIIFFDYCLWKMWKIDFFLNLKIEKRVLYMNSWYVFGMWNCFLKIGGRVRFNFEELK